jgi:DNA-binding transcriptional MerR regulator
MSASESALPSKLFFRIGEVASLVGVEPHVLRYWEREFRSIRPTKSAKGQRVYSRKDVDNLLRVRDLLYRDGFTIAGAKKRLQRAVDPVTNGDSPEHLDQIAQIAQIGHVTPQVESDGHDERDDERDEDVEPIASEEPESGPRSHASSDGRDGRAHVEPVVRKKLTALRAEVEAFLHELESERV